MHFLFPSTTDIIDIVILWLIIYRVIIIAKKVGGYQILLGIALLIIFISIANLLNLTMVLSIIGILRDYWLLVIVILFQPEIRSILAKISNANIITPFRRDPKQSIYAPLINAVSTMSFIKKGALIVIENDYKLNKYIEQAERIDAILSSKLITSIFDKGSLLHDGAAIIRKDRIVVAKAILPISKNPEYRMRGTRHLAAVGVTEEGDPLAIVVSEETGSISVARNGVLESNIDIGRLTQIITDSVV